MRATGRGQRAGRAHIGETQGLGKATKLLVKQAERESPLERNSRPDVVESALWLHQERMTGLRQGIGEQAKSEVAETEW
jgi:hypothetical protein